jgi:cell shape-determining protein MreC
VTAGTSRLYPPGLVIGYVRGVSRPFDSMFAEVEVAPAEDMAALENVFVVKWLPPGKE